MKVLLPFVAMLTALLFGCTTEPDPEDNTERDAVIYGSVIGDVAERSGFDRGDSEDPPVVFVEAFDSEGTPLEVQVAVIAAMSERFEIRFIDRRGEAVDVDLVNHPVRPESLLIGLGPIGVDDTVSLRAELYLSSDRVTAFVYDMSGSDGRWIIQDGSPRQVAPEGFVSP